MSWADEQNKKELNDQESQKTSNELRLRDERKLDEIAPGVFAQLKTYVDNEVKKFNAQRGSADGMFWQ